MAHVTLCSSSSSSPRLLAYRWMRTACRYKSVWQSLCLTDPGKSAHFFLAFGAIELAVCLHNLILHPQNGINKQFSQCANSPSLRSGKTTICPRWHVMRNQIAAQNQWASTKKIQLNVSYSVLFFRGIPTHFAAEAVARVFPSRWWIRQERLDFLVRNTCKNKQSCLEMQQTMGKTNNWNKLDEDNTLPIHTAGKKKTLLGTTRRSNKVKRSTNIWPTRNVPVKQHERWNTKKCDDRVRW